MERNMNIGKVFINTGNIKRICIVLGNDNLALSYDLSGEAFVFVKINMVWEQA